MGTIYGYARCDTSEDRVDILHQRRDLEDMGVDESRIFFEFDWDTRAEMNEQRKQRLYHDLEIKTKQEELDKLLKIVQPGDTIATTGVRRLTTSTRHLCEILQFVKDNHLCLLLGSLAVDCRDNEPDPLCKGMMLMFGVFAELELEQGSADRP